MPDEPVRKGKIGRLPVAIRNEVNRRILDNESGAKILSWLNEQPEVLRVLDDYFGEEPVNPQNLSEWRKGGYQDWLRRRERSECIKDLALTAQKLGEAAAGNMAEGSAAILGGQILKTLEDALDENLTNTALSPDQLMDFVKAISLLRMGDAEKAKLALRKQVIDQRDQVIALAKKKFKRQTCEMFLEWYDDERAKKVVDSRASNDEKLEELGKVMFGRDW